mgnify:CR=1 FL=1
MFDVGRICVKLAGRDAGKKCVIVQKQDDGNVLIDGQTRRRTCNVRHIEPTPHTVDLKDGASHEDVKAVLREAYIEVRETTPKQAGERPKRQKRKKERPEKKAKKQPKKKAAERSGQETQESTKPEQDEAKQALAGESSGDSEEKTGQEQGSKQ